ncbi:YL1 nuclear protein-domain-containing protein [Pisolithus croceorrhizus]|nr:YL1 nuclear protein-domain-containing protein [Pisolithus croceorrhizus]KAI6116593.1 YL1 nuclear protein-domain-containing protein [Pisolithus croceorrhizus]KAI6159454.1 YL1 nuclear protein-domain-containing protein [Pisolithus thermaeus]
MAEEGGLSSRRPRRSTAGNRMELALAELALEETPEVEDDTDFINDRDEEDVFESDFMSTDEEAAREDHAGDEEVREAERRERKAVRARVEKATAIAHARQRATFDPGAAPSVSKSSIQKSRRRVSLGPVVNAETGEVIEGTTSGATVMTVGVKRKSQRRHTVMSTTATATRMKDAEEKKAALPKKQKIIMSAPTQDELIARALDTEEGNILEHRNYLQLEEEKRARARVVRQSISGPMLRWISRKEQTKEAVQLEQPPRMYVPYYNFTYPTGTAVQSTVGTTASGTTGGPFVNYVPPVAEGPLAANESTSNIAGVLAPNSSPAPQPSVTSATIPRTPTPSTTSPSTLPQSSASIAPPEPLIEERTMDVCRNYVIHELTQTQSAKKPLWVDTMSAMFGDHVAWGDLRVYTGKNRPFSRPLRICPITGLPARYLDPRTNVPFASVAAFHTLTKVLSREYTWSESLGCYVTPGAITPQSGASSEEPERSAEKHKGEGSERE